MERRHVRTRCRPRRQRPAPDRGGGRRRRRRGAAAAYEGPPGCIHGTVIAAAFDLELNVANLMSGAAGLGLPEEPRGSTRVLPASGTPLMTNGVKVSKVSTPSPTSTASANASSTTSARCSSSTAASGARRAERAWAASRPRVARPGRMNVVVLERRGLRYVGSQCQPPGRCTARPPTRAGGATSSSTASGSRTSRAAAASPVSCCTATRRTTTVGIRSPPP